MCRFFPFQNNKGEHFFVNIIAFVNVAKMKIWNVFILPFSHKVEKWNSKARDSKVNF